ncbi:MAG: glycosyltransferase family 2 protein [Kiloniellales bacterium]
MTSNKKIAVLVPCHNEELTIAAVTRAFRQVLPECRVYVYDNNSTDSTRERAAGAGAVVRSEPLQGKGNVVRRMFADIDADLYVLVDGDNTYDVAAARRMVDLLVSENLDMVVGARTDTVDAAAFRRGHRFGNLFLSGCVAALFGKRFNDVLSGYRILSRRFVKSFPALARGFEIETELTVHALELRMPAAEVDTRYGARPEGSGSKLKTFRDGLRIGWTILLLLKEVRPFAFFGAIFAALAVASVALAWPLLLTYLETGLVPRLPTAVLATGMMLLAFLSLTSGLILDSVSRGRRELKRMAYLGIAPFQRDAVRSEPAESGSRAAQ